MKYYGSVIRTKWVKPKLYLFPTITLFSYSNWKTVEIKPDILKLIQSVKRLSEYLADAIILNEIFNIVTVLKNLTPDKD